MTLRALFFLAWLLLGSLLLARKTDVPADDAEASPVDVEAIRSPAGDSPLDYSWETIDHAERKVAQQGLRFDSHNVVAIGLLAGQVAGLIVLFTGSEPLSTYSSLAVVAFAVGIAINAVLLVVVKHSEAPDPLLLALSAAVDPDAARADALSDLLASYDSNKISLNRRDMGTLVSLAFTALALLAIAAPKVVQCFPKR